MNNQPSNYDVALGLLQVIDVLLNLDQVSNDTLLAELQHQNKDYLEKIVAQVTNFPNQFKFRQECIEQELKKLIEQNNCIIKQNMQLWEEIQAIRGAE